MDIPKIGFCYFLKKKDWILFDRLSRDMVGLSLFFKSVELMLFRSSF